MLRSRQTITTVTKAVIAGSLLVVLSACSGEAEPVEPKGSAATEAPTSAPPPPMPDEAKADTEEGAIAFVEHYVELFNLAANTGNAAPMLAASSSECQGCANYARAFEQSLEGGGEVDGFAWSLSEGEIDNSMSVEAEVDLKEYRVKNNGDEEWKKVLAAQYRVGFKLERRGSGWTMQDLYRTDVEK